MPLDAVLHGCESDSGVPNFDCHGSREAPQRRLIVVQILLPESQPLTPDLNLPLNVRRLVCFLCCQ